MKIIGIYKIQNLCNGKVYIGQSTNIKGRWSSERRFVSNPGLQKDFEQFGLDKFDFSIVKECAKSELDKEEAFFIKKYDSTNPLKGYNLYKGGKRAKMPIEIRKKISKANTGKIRTLEARKKMSIAKQQMSAESKHKMALAKSKGKVICLETGEIFESCRDANRKKGLSSVNDAVKGYQLVAGGYHWKLYEIGDENRLTELIDQIESRLKGNHSKKRKVICIETNKIYESLAAAGREIGVKGSSIHKVCNENHRVVKGYHYKYLEEC